MVLTIFQCFKVVYAFIPGTLGYIVGPTLFGSIEGIICNYVGICLGSFIAFGLSRKFGDGIMRQIFSEKRSEKYKRWLKRRSESKNFSVFLWLALLIPFSPDDFLCYFAGLTEISLDLEIDEAKEYLKAQYDKLLAILGNLTANQG